MATSTEIRCPGCGLALPASDTAVYAGYYHASPECWSVYTEVLGAEFGNALLFGQVHQLTVDAYAVQHAGGDHPGKSVTVHLVGLHLVLEEGVPPPLVAPRLQRLAAARETWPAFAPPADRGALTVFDVALAGTATDHAERSRAWASDVWRTWSDHHPAVAELVAAHVLA